MRRFATFFLACFCFAAGVAGQESFVPGTMYKGLRISLFHFEVMDQSPKSVLLRCDAANTGRYAVAFGKKQAPPAALVVELDTLNLPRLLLGWEERVSAALLRQKIALKPGEIQTEIFLKINLSPKKPPVAAPPEQRPPRPAIAVARCTDLRLDTAFVVRRDESTLLLRFTLYNAGPGAVRLTGARKGQEDNVALNAYFVRESKLTRGAVLATGIFLGERRDLPDDLLLPGRQITAEMEINLRDRTRFAPNLVLELDPFQSADDCDRTNNTFAVPLNF